ncbi:MAG: Uncharacterized protein YaaO [Firmicutes bacterium]|nr:Uncharacterized protein YaaO [Bacillota bacterium]MDI6705100.1 aminotransferase class I/II-fold pyridoxal phosphate-dependent enzyme [Bacillota bacterium]
MQNRRPLLDALMQHLAENPVSFHVPGHKSQFPYGHPEKEFLSGMSKLDLTELPGLDNLHCPAGAIREAQELAAEVYGVDRTYFLVNGSTCGILAALLAAARPGECVVVDRFSHSSVSNGLALGRLTPAYVNRRVDCDTGIPLSLDLEELERVIKQHPRASAVIVTSPSYFGICSDIKSISGLAHDNGMILIVDEAHGAHLKFCGRLPESAVDAGADIVIQSAHKTLAAMTQGSWLHVRGDRVDTGRLESMLGIFQSTSPSYPIMASLDAARAVMASAGEDMLSSLVLWVRDARAKLNSGGKGFFCPGLEYFTGKGAYAFDETRLIINVRNAGITGLQLDSALRDNGRVYGEMYDYENWLGIATVGNTQADFRALVRACETIRTAPGTVRDMPDYSCCNPPTVLNPWEVMERNSRRVLLEEAEGMVSASGVIPYPPGIPLVCPGERITRNVIERIKEYSRLGISIKGCNNGEIDAIY